MTLAYIALGSNLGNRRLTFKNAVEEISCIPTLKLVRTSPLYETAPMGLPIGSPFFLNAVAEVEAECTPYELLEILLKIEQKFGRIRSKSTEKESRIIDLDILLFGDCHMMKADLQIPHPRMCEREFVLRPLANLCPETKIPGKNQTVAEALLELTNKSSPDFIRRVD